ncbi:MAG: tetratricopeptide repeat protein [Colwellia sp.]|nr:tetratricopeptide repeat protein [Colwellia sp.]
MESLLAQFKQRQIFKVATIYAVSAWPLIQIADLAVPALGLPDSVMTLLLKIFIIGFPISLVFAWLFNFTSKGIVRINEKDSFKEDSNPAVNVRTTIAVAGSLVVALTATLLTQFFLESNKEPNIVPARLPTPIEKRSELARETKKSIAILPFVPFSSDPEDEYFADGMVEELLNLLAKIPDLKVAARTSSFAYKGNVKKTIVEIGKELGVETILEGSIRKNDVSNKIRVTAQLIQVSTGEHLWSETYDREYRDIFKIQDEIARSVVDKMKITLLGQSTKRQFIAGTHSVDAMVEYGKGQQELSHRTAPSIEKALIHFNKAIEQDKNYARAFVGIADANMLLALYGNLAVSKSNRAAQVAIDRALQIDSQLGEAYASQGLLYTRTDKEKSVAAFKQAIKLNPNYAMTYMWYGSLLQMDGDIGGAHELFEKAFELDPKSPVAAYNVAWCYYLIGAEGKAMGLFSQIIANDPYYPGAYNLAGGILKNRGRLDESIDMYQRALQVDAVNKDALKGLFAANMDMFNFTATDQWFTYVKNNPLILSNNEIFMMKARYAAVQGNIEQGIEHLQSITFDDKEMKGKSNFIKGEIAFYQKKYSDAINLLTQVIDDKNINSFYRLSDGQTAIHLSYAYQQLEQFDKAEELLISFEKYLQNSVSKKANSSSFYYNMMAINALRDQEGLALNYLQGAIDSGWVETWRVGFEPIFNKLKKAPRFGQMIGGVIAKLENMKANSDINESFLLVDSE